MLPRVKIGLKSDCNNQDNTQKGRSRGGELAAIISAITSLIWVLYQVGFLPFNPPPAKSVKPSAVQKTSKPVVSKVPISKPSKYCDVSFLNEEVDNIFFAKYPERKGKLIQPDEALLAKEWLSIRNQISSCK